LIRALGAGELPIELSMRGARWRENVDGLGREISDQLAEVERKAFKESRLLRQELEALRQVLVLPEKTEE
jgi:hypothetical protein